MFEVDKKELAEEALINLLKKLGLKSADLASVNITLNHLMNMIHKDMGAPSTLYMSPADYASFSKSLEPDPKLTKEDD